MELNADTTNFHATAFAERLWSSNLAMKADQGGLDVAPHRLGAGAAPGKAVPGYAGYVHGVRPEPDIMGMPFKAANEHADKEPQTEAESFHSCQRCIPKSQRQSVRQGYQLWSFSHIIQAKLRFQIKE
eukprot:g13797.t1